MHGSRPGVKPAAPEQPALGRTPPPKWQPKLMSSNAQVQQCPPAPQPPPVRPPAPQRLPARPPRAPATPLSCARRPPPPARACTPAPPPAPGEKISSPFPLKIRVSFFCMNSEHCRACCAVGLISGDVGKAMHCGEQQPGMSECACPAEPAPYCSAAPVSWPRAVPGSHRSSSQL